MKITLDSLKQALVGQLDQTDVIANNLANIGSIGFKRDLVFFDLIDQNDEQQQKTNMATDFSQGPLKETTNPLDLAISGPGLFTVETDKGLALTRDGHFRLDGDGVLRTEQGYAVRGEGGWITLTGEDLTPNDITITSNGEIYVGDTYIDRLLIQDVEDKTTLRKVGTNLFMPEEDAELIEVEEPELHQGFLEEANINPADEMIQLIEVQRQFESIQRMVRTLDDTFRQAANDLGKY